MSHWNKTKLIISVMVQKQSLYTRGYKRQSHHDNQLNVRWDGWTKENTGVGLGIKGLLLNTKRKKETKRHGVQIPTKTVR